MRSFSNFDKECLRNVNARVFTNQMWTDRQRTKTNPKTSPEQSAIFQLVQEINKTNAKNVTSLENCPIPLAAMFIDPSGPFANSSEIYIKQIYSPSFIMIGHKKVTSTLHEDWALNVTSTVFKLDQDFIGTNLLTKFHEDRTINVASRVFTNKCGRTDERRTKTSHKSSPEQSVKSIFGNVNAKCDGKTNRRTDRQTDGRTLLLKTATSPWQPCFSTDQTIFKLNSRI
ncbi:hypothetical protein DPMN_004491 [Dreissena polymorpha]|uniref:Uncharacterized protein n=1 Tax=Dreissena polymorpha TaxID=45954 RepID=A0A9D4RTL3_DREPO|nr:hypothetical protein DPMN_004491 [Dreissena polymorpha]